MDPPPSRPPFAGGPFQQEKDDDPVLASLRFRDQAACSISPTPSMEFDTPWAPTPPSERLAAVRAYVEGEALCDAGDYAAGTLRLRAAGRLAWELEREVWPSWATSLRAALLGALGKMGRRPAS